MRRFLKRLFLFTAIPAAVAVVWTTFVVVTPQSFAGGT